MATIAPRKRWSLARWFYEQRLRVRNWYDGWDDRLSIKGKSRAEVHESRNELHHELKMNRLYHLAGYLMVMILIAMSMLEWGDQLESWMILALGSAVGALIGGALVSFLHHTRRINYHKRCQRESSRRRHA